MKPISRKVIYVIAAVAVIASLSFAYQNHSQRKARQIALTLLPAPSQTDQAFPQMTLALASMFSPNIEKLGANPDDIDAFTQTLAKTSAEQFAIERHRTSIEYMTNAFSLRELTEIAAFEASPTGKAFDAKEPHITSYSNPTPEELQWIRNLPPEQSNTFFTFMKSKGGQALQREEADLFSTSRRDIERKAMEIVADSATHLLHDESLVRFTTPEQRLRAIKTVSETFKQASMKDMR